MDCGAKGYRGSDEPSRAPGGWDQAEYNIKV